MKILIFAIALFFCIGFMGCTTGGETTTDKDTVEVCLIDVGMACESNAQVFVKDDNFVYLSVSLINQLGESINANSITAVCTESTTVTNDFIDAHGKAIAGSVAPGSILTLSAIPCYDSDGNPLELKKGSLFKGTIAISYNTESDTNSKHITTGMIQENVITG